MTNVREAVKIPPSLGNFPATSTPLYFSLTGKLTGQWKEQDSDKITSSPNIQYILPIPKTGFNLSTSVGNSDEMSLLSMSLGGAVSSTGVGQILYGVYQSMTKGDEYEKAMSHDLAAGEAGGVLLPSDKTRIRFRGGNKRAYQFSFELWAYTNEDAVAIQQFMRTMHACTMTQTTDGVPSGAGELGLYFRVPPLFVFGVLGENGIADVTNRFFVDPKPCMLVGFHTSTLPDPPNLTPAQYSGRIYATMSFAEVEPTAWKGSFDTGQVVLQYQHGASCTTD